MSEPQFSLFGEGADRLQTPVRAIDPGGRARRQLRALLAQLRAADTLPMGQRELDEWVFLVPQMSKWFSPEEADEVRRTFAHEVARLTSRRA